MLNKPTRKYVRKAIRIKSAKSYSTLERLEFAMRGHELLHLPHIKFQNGDRWYAIFEGYGLSPEAISRCETNMFKVV